MFLLFCFHYFVSGSAECRKPLRSAGSFKSSWACSNPAWNSLNAVSRPTPCRKSLIIGFTFCCFQPLQTLLQALLKRAFCRNRTRAKVRLPSELQKFSQSKSWFVAQIRLLHFVKPRIPSHRTGGEVRLPSEPEKLVLTSQWFGFPFCCFEPLHTFFKHIPKWAFCRDRTNIILQPESSFVAHMRPDSVFCWPYPPCKKGFVEHMRPLQFAMVFAINYIPIGGASSNTITNISYPNVIIWLAHHGFILLFSVTP